ncbi:aldose 1-epimerase [Paenibacillus medicaginis]|uniref:Aldose 1-epimerase n=1 Tax=Paenibacillus medicaginis TaxID=1470560 RepID=A0ABV5C8F5_9BACL
MKQVTKGHWNGYDTYILHSRELEVTLLPRLGNNVISMRDNINGREILRKPAEEDLSFYLQKPYHFGIPMLIPPGRIRGGHFVYDQVEYQFDRNTANDNHIHGLHRTQAWCVSDIEEDDDFCSITTEFLTDNDENWMRQFPVPLRLEMVYRLEGSSFSQTLKVTHQGETAVPFGIGYHTWFLLDGEPERWSLKLPVNGIYALDEQLLPTGEVEGLGALAQLPEGISLKDQNLDTPLRVADGPAVALLARDDGYSIKYSADEQFFKHWVLYTKGEADQFLCIEPYTWLPDAPNLKQGKDVTGLIRLEPRQTVDLHTCLEIILP